MIERVIFIKRQSPDWASLAGDHRAGRPINPRRFVPDHPIPGFPPNIEALVQAWNERFDIDFFTVRDTIAQLSAANILEAGEAESHDLSNLAGIARRAASEHFIAFFHDDDDVFAPGITARLRAVAADAYETCVFPLYRIGADLFTFVPAGVQPDAVLGRSKPFDFRFQSNNYGLASRICSAGNLRSLKDHVLGSAFADARGWTEGAYPLAVSATVKTPASASQLPDLFTSEATLQARFQGFIAQCRRLHVPAQEAWLLPPVHAIATLLEAVLAGEGYDAAEALL